MKFSPKLKSTRSGNPGVADDLTPIQLQPGLFTLETDRGAETRWKTGNRVRFFKGLPQPIGGWVKQSSLGQFAGACRNMIDFRTLAGTVVIGLGTHVRYYLNAQGQLHNITPYRLWTSQFGGTDSALINPFATTNGSATVTVTHSTHGAIVGDYVTFQNATAVGGITIAGTYNVASTPTANTYTITHSSPANATTTGGGTVHYAYEINVGVTEQVSGLGWGAGRWGASTWGTPRTSTVVTALPRTWSHDPWGEDLIINPRGGSIYWWDATLGFSTRATRITGSPAQAAFILVSPLDRTLIAFGATPQSGGGRDPLLIRWCNQEDFTDWIPSTTNTAGDKRLDVGNEIIAALRVSREILVFTDKGVTSMFLVGGNDVFGFQQLSDTYGPVGPNCMIEFGGRAYWMGHGDFFLYDGGIGRLPCDVQNYVFDDYNEAQDFKTHCTRNERFGEVSWFYCSANSQEIDRYVTLNVDEQHWTFGELDRTAWLAHGKNLPEPLAAGPDGYLYAHELGTTADGQPLGEFLESWDAEISKGNRLMHISKLIPDFLDLQGSVSVKLKAKKYPHGQQKERGPWSVTSGTEFVKPRIRGRQVALRLDGETGFWRMGQWRADVKPHGSR
jgi:hypothetical protein